MKRIAIMKLFLLLALLAAQLCAQSNTGELHLAVTDPVGLGTKSSVELISAANVYRQSFLTDDEGTLVVQHLPFGNYRVEIRQGNFAVWSQPLEIRSELPSEIRVQLGLAPVHTVIDVTEKSGAVDPHSDGSANRIGPETIDQRPASLPGRSLQELVNSQPGWLFEGNAALHPRGSEYQTQMVLDGIPLTDDRSPGRGPEIEAENLESISIYTAGIPAEYGRKLGGVIEINTEKNPRQGAHGEAVLSGASFGTALAYAELQYAVGKNQFSVSGSGTMTDRYLNPPVPENYTNTGTTGDFSGRYERASKESGGLSVMFRHELTRYRVPNERVQEDAGQRQDGAIFENMGIVSYRRAFSPDVLIDVRGLVRSNSDDLSSNPSSTPVIVFHHNQFNEMYLKAAASVRHRNHEWKLGVDSDAIFLHERFADTITDPLRFDPGTPLSFSFAGNRPDLEQSAFVQDRIRLGNWTVSTGIRWDHYQLLVNQNAISPRLGVARYFEKADLLLHASYDRVMQTPSFRNILLASSTQVSVLNPSVLRLPLSPSLGNYYELGLTKGIEPFKLDLRGFERAVNNFADDDLLLNTPISFPISFRKARIYGAEAKVTIARWGRLSGFLSYSYMVGSAYFPVTGGLFLGQSATDALTQLTGRFWITQDERHFARTRWHYQITPRVWSAVGAEYGTGLPVEFDGTHEQALEEYGQRVIDRVNFARSRVQPYFSLNASVGTDIVKRDNLAIKLQADAENLNNRLNLVNFAGLFSGNSIAPPRAYAIRLMTRF